METTSHFSHGVRHQAVSWEDGGCEDGLATGETTFRIDTSPTRHGVRHRAVGFGDVTLRAEAGSGRMSRVRAIFAACEGAIWRCMRRTLVRDDVCSLSW